MGLNLTNRYNHAKTIKDILISVEFMWEEGFSRLKKRMLLFSLFCFFDIIATAYFCKSPDYETSILVRIFMLQFRSVQLGALIGVVGVSLLPIIGFAFIWFWLLSRFLKKKLQHNKINMFFIEDVTLIIFMISAAPHFEGGLSWIISLAYPWTWVAFFLGLGLYKIGDAIINTKHIKRIFSKKLK